MHHAVTGAHESADRLGKHGIASRLTASHRHRRHGLIAEASSTLISCGTGREHEVHKCALEAQRGPQLRS
jgi:hypothetical protein